MNGLSVLGNICKNIGDYNQAKPLLKEAFSIAETLQDSGRIAAHLNNLAVIEEVLGNYDDAKKYYQRVLDMDQREGNDSGATYGLNNLGTLLVQTGEIKRGQELLEIGLKLATKLQLHQSIPYFLNNLATAAIESGHIDKARNLSLNALEMIEVSGETSNKAMILINLGRIAAAQANYLEASSYFEQALRISLAIGEIPRALEVLLEYAIAMKPADDPKWICTVFSFMKHHPAAEQLRKDKAEKMLVELEDSLSEQDYVKAMEEGITAQLQGLIEEVIHKCRWERDYVQ
jgi:tetratricopeptide (TPR) repeat protein